MIHIHPYVSVMNSSCFDSLTIQRMRLSTEPERECMDLPEKGNRIIFASGLRNRRDQVRSSGETTRRDDWNWGAFEGSM